MTTPAATGEEPATPRMVLVCGGNGTHRPRHMDVAYRDPDGWTSGLIEAFAAPDAGLMGVRRDARGTWHLECPSCRQPPRRLSARNMDQLLDLAETRGFTHIDIAQLNL